MNLKNHFVYICILFICPLHLNSQTYLISTAGTVNSCSGTLYDSGGSGSSYGNNQNYTKTFCSSNSTCLNVNFTSFSTESGWDILYIYNGNSTSAPLIGAFSGFSSPGNLTTTSGCITFRFVSDGSSVYSGWIANITCVACPPPPALTQQNCAGGVTICNNQTISGNSSGPGNYADLNNGNDGCLAGEDQTTWWYFSPATSGTIAFTIDPVNNTDDYDFAIWGPLTSISCPPSGTPLRCSWSLIDDQTGLRSSAADLSEGSGGDSWVAPMNVIAGQIYIMVIDNFDATTQPYNLTWNLTNGASLDCTIALPVSFVEFMGQPKDHYNLLRWITETESNNDYFIIERSTDGENWTILENVNAVGNSQTTSNYSYQDFDFMSNRINYYRLSQVDIDGEKRVLDMVSVDNTISTQKIIKTTNLLGQEVKLDFHGYVLYVYSDGSVKKGIQ